MFLEIENQIINLDLVSRIIVEQNAQAIWGVHIRDSHQLNVFSKTFHTKEEAIAFVNKFSEVLKPVQFN
jgi:hypothetical protein